MPAQAEAIPILEPAPIVQTVEAAAPLPLPETPEERIVRRAKEFGYDPTKALAIAWAESRFKNVPNYKYDGETGRYTAYGIFQFTRTTYRAFCGDPDERMDIDKNIDCAVRMLAEGGESHWNESRDNWHLYPGWQDL